MFLYRFPFSNIMLRTLAVKSYSNYGSSNCFWCFLQFSNDSICYVEKNDPGRMSWSSQTNLFNLRPCHTLPDSANGRVTDSKILCPFVSVRMRFLSVPHAVNAFRVR